MALCAGYGSHEAFTRAFRRQFGLPPEALRANGLSANIQLVEPIRMDKTLLTDLDPPRFVDGEELLIAGIGARYTFETNQGIPAQWQRFGPHIGHVPSQCGPETFGLCANADNSGSFEYIAGVRVSEFSDLPEGLSGTRVPRRRYVVFTHKGHVSQLRRTHYTIWNKWVPESGVPIRGRSQLRAVRKRVQSRDGPRFDRSLDAGRHVGLFFRIAMIFLSVKAKSW